MKIVEKIKKHLQINDNRQQFRLNNTTRKAAVVILSFVALLSIYPAQQLLFDNETHAEDTATIRWENYDGSLLEIDENVDYGTMPTYDEATPTRNADMQYTYEFAGWQPIVSEVVGDITYVAQYNELTRSYTVRWENYDNNLLEEDLNVEYGTMPTYNGVAPTRSEDSGFTYDFIGWAPDISHVTGDVTYVAQYNPIRKIQIEFMAEEGGILNGTTVFSIEHGTMWGEYFDGLVNSVPTLIPNAGYEFTGWSPGLPNGNYEIISDLFFTAQWRLIDYTISYYDEDGEWFDEYIRNYGDAIPVPLENPTKDADQFYSYIFDEWELTDGVEGAGKTVGTTNLEYTAKYNAIPVDYIIKYLPGEHGAWNDGDHTFSANYGEDTPLFNGEPIGERGYMFIGWDKVVVDTVTDNATYTAQWAIDSTQTALIELEYYFDGRHDTSYDDVYVPQVLEIIDEDNVVLSQSPVGYLFNETDKTFPVLAMDLDGRVVRVYYVTDPDYAIVDEDDSDGPVVSPPNTGAKYIEVGMVFIELSLILSAIGLMTLLLMGWIRNRT